MEALSRMVTDAVACNDYDTLSAIFADEGATATTTAATSWHSIGPGEKRSLAAHLIQTVVNAPSSFRHVALSRPDTQHVLIQALNHVPTTVEHAADNTLRQYLFDQLVHHDQQYAQAAHILGGMRMEDAPDSVYYVAPADKLNVYVQMAECCLACDGGDNNIDLTAEADAAVTKAGAVVASVEKTPDHLALLLRYKATCARVLDGNRKFLTAAQRYYELSTPPAYSNSNSSSSMSSSSNNNGSNDWMIDADDLLQLLGRAATCAILAPSGPQRQRVLGHISQDSRLSELDHLPDFATHATLLRKMYRHEIVPATSPELVAFAATLADHQKAIRGDGMTILERGMVEHNLIAVSKLYRSIYVTELAHHLGVSASKAEHICASMIMEGSLHGSIDQVEGLLEFAPDEAPEQTWDRSITSFCVALNRVTDHIKAAAANV